MVQEGPCQDAILLLSAPHALTRTPPARRWGGGCCTGRLACLGSGVQGLGLMVQEFEASGGCKTFL